MNNDNDLNLQLHDQMSGLLRCWYYPTEFIKQQKHLTSALNAT